MERLEMVEELRKRVNVSYEEAKAALEENNWDLLEAIMALEKAGRMTGAAAAEEQTAEKEEKQEKASEEAAPKKKGFKEKIRSFIHYCSDNEIQINRKGKNILQVPLIILLLVLLFAWEAILPVMVIALFFGVNYNFVEKDDEEKAKEAVEAAENCEGVLEN